MKRRKTRYNAVQIRRLVVIGAILLAGFIAALAILLFQTRSLSLRLSDLQNENAKMALQASEYQKAYCTASFSAVKANTTTTYTMSSDGYARAYRVHTPRDYDPTVRYPMILNFDGIGGSGSRIEAYSHIDSLPVIAVYPDSLRGKQGFTAWQGAPYSLKGDYDTQFVRDLLTTVPENYCVDSTNVFAVGMSNGGGFAAIVACSLSDKFRAVASLSGAYYAKCGETTGTPSLLIVHSESDKQVPYDGSTKRGLPAVMQWATREASERDCQSMEKNNAKNSDTAVKSNTLITYNWQGCRDGSLLQLVVVKNQSHGWLQIPRSPGSTSSSTATYIWDFFQRAASRTL